MLIFPVSFDENVNESKTLTRKTNNIRNPNDRTPKQAILVISLM